MKKLFADHFTSKKIVRLENKNIYHTCTIYCWALYINKSFLFLINKVLHDHKTHAFTSLLNLQTLNIIAFNIRYLKIMCFDHKLKTVLFTLYIYIAVICKYCYSISLVDNFSLMLTKGYIYNIFWQLLVNEKVQDPI